MVNVHGHFGYTKFKLIELALESQEERLNGLVFGNTRVNRKYLKTATNLHMEIN